MKWTEWGPYAISADSFVVSKASVGGTFRYLLWHNGQLVRRGKPFDSAADAKRRAVQILAADHRGPVCDEPSVPGGDRVGADAGG